MQTDEEVGKITRETPVLVCTWIDYYIIFANINNDYYNSQSFGMLHPGFDQQNCRHNTRKKF